MLNIRPEIKNVTALSDQSVLENEISKWNIKDSDSGIECVQSSSTKIRTTSSQAMKDLEFLNELCQYITDVDSKNKVLLRLEQAVNNDQTRHIADVLVTAKLFIKVDIFSLADLLVDEMWPTDESEKEIKKISCLETFFRLFADVLSQTGIHHDSTIKKRILRLKLHIKLFKYILNDELPATLQLRNCMAKATSQFMNPDLFIVLSKSISYYENRLWKLFSTGKKHLQLLSLECLRIFCRHNTKGSLLDDEKLVYCFCLMDFYEKRPSFVEVLEVIYYLLTSSLEKFQRRFFHHQDFQGRLRKLKIPDEGRFWTEKLSHVQMSLLSRPPTTRVQKSSWKSQQARGRFGVIRASIKSLTTSDGPISLGIVNDLYSDENECLLIKDRTLELDFVVQDRSNIVYRNNLIKREATSDDIYLEKVPSDKQLAQHLVALLNSYDDQFSRGRIFIGVKSNGFIDGIMMTRTQKDHFRQRFDCLLMNLIIPKLPMILANCPIRSPEFHQIPDAGGDQQYNRYIIKIIVDKQDHSKIFELKDVGVFKRVDGESLRLKTTK